MKIRTLFLLFFCLMQVRPLFAQGEGNIDIDKGNEAYGKKDYYSALVFYSRAMGTDDITDGVIWYKTAYSYETIKGKDPLLDALYNISFYYLIQKDPDHPYTDVLKSKLTQSMAVNARMIKKTRLELSGRVAEPGPEAERMTFQTLKSKINGWILFFRDGGINKYERMQLPYNDFKKGGVVSGIRSLFLNWEVLLLGWLILSIPTGLILPFVLSNYKSSRGKGKGLIETYLLWFHWGFLGVHRFYLGQYLAGILLLVTLGGFGIGWIIEGILLVRNFHKGNTGGGRGSFHKAVQSGGRSSAKTQPERQVSRRRPAEDNFEGFNLLSSGEEL